MPRFHNTLSLTAVAAIAFALSGCATWSTSSVDTSKVEQTAGNTSTAATAKKVPSQVQITDRDIVDRRYESLGDITVTVNKTTVFHPEPTRELVNAKLQEKAAELGADAVVLVRYGSGGISLMSWGSLEGKGRAVKFAQ